MIRITIWNEFRHEKSDEAIAKVYPHGLHAALAQGIEMPDFQIRLACLDEPQHGLTEAVLRDTDVLIWWGHIAHDEVADEVAARVCRHVNEGMGAIFLHSAHHSKPFRMLLGTTGNLTWREDQGNCRVWAVAPAHPILQGVPAAIELAHEEMYGEPFDIPAPDELLTINWYKGGEVFRSGVTYKRGYGKVFYFQPGHEAFPTYYNPHILRVIQNAARWAQPVIRRPCACVHREEPLEQLD